MNVGSLFSGVGGMDYGLHRAGFTHRFFAESDEWRRGVLAHHWPGVPIYDDVRAVGEPTGRAATNGGGASVDGWGWEAGAGLLCGGFPCQDVSVAGRRAGLAGARSGLFHEFARIIGALRPGWVLVENVPGLLSSNGGRDFGVVLGTLADLGYGVGWRVLDSRFFGVPQRRRRVFIIGTVAGDDPRAAAGRAGEVLAVGTRCPGHPPAGHQAGPDVAPTLGASVGGGRGWDANPDRTALITDRECDAVSDGAGRRSCGPEAAARTTVRVAAPLSHGSNPNSNAAGRRREDDENLVAGPLGGGNDGAGRRSEDDPSLVYPLARRGRDGGSELEVGEAGIYNALRAGDGGSSRLNQVMIGMGVRRLTPRECERLQALPDDWTAHGADSRRYAALGDAVTASVAEFIGRRILAASLVPGRKAEA